MRLAVGRNISAERRVAGFRELYPHFAHRLAEIFVKDCFSGFGICLVVEYHRNFNPVPAFNHRQFGFSREIVGVGFAAAIRDFKFIGSGGEKYPEALLEKLRELTGARIVNTYGSTETTISSNMKDLTEAASITVGRPLLNVVEFIVDGDGKGYNNLPEMTAARFLEFKSGDYARWSIVCALFRRRISD